MEPHVSFDEFQPSTYSEWKKRVMVELGEKPFDSLLKINAEGLHTEPGYTHDHHGPIRLVSTKELPYLFRTPKEYWEIRVDVSGSVSHINNQILSALQGGASEIGINCAHQTPEVLPQLLDGVFIEMISVHLMHADAPEKWILALTDLAQSRQLNLLELHGSVSYDWVKELDRLPSISTYFKTLPGFRFFTVDALSARNAGASAENEIAHALAAGQEILHQLTASGVLIDDAAAMISFQFGIGTEYFTEVAKYRTFRSLWIEVVRAYSPIHDCTYHARIHAETAFISLGQRDESSNLLRLTTEAMSAVLGGVNSLHVRSSESSVESPSDQSMRWSRNIQHLLRDECALHLAEDPASGSWYLETLCGQLAEKAWARFLAIESKGGFLSQQSSLMEVYATRFTEVQEEKINGARVLVGENKYVKK